MNTLTADKFCKKSGISYSCLRKYIKLGFVSYPEIRGQYLGYYSSEDVNIVKVVRKLVQLGVGLKECVKLSKGITAKHYPKTITILGQTYVRQ